MMTATMMTRPDVSSGGQLVATDGRTLPLLGMCLAVRAQGGLARAVLVQVFRNDTADPLEVVYRFPLPHDGAVSAFAFRLGERRIRRS